jgi:hypothetical protein
MSARPRRDACERAGVSGDPLRRNEFMATTLDHGLQSPPVVRKGHGPAALGPSDSSDTGSDIQGGPGLAGDDGLLAPQGDTSDPNTGASVTTAGPRIGDGDLNSDSDRNGTGERAAAGRDATLPVDALLRDDNDRLVDGESLDDASLRNSAAESEVAGRNRVDVGDDNRASYRVASHSRRPHVRRE